MRGRGSSPFGVSPRVRAVGDAFKVLAVLLVAVLLQVTTVVDVRLFSGRPDLVLVLVVAVGLVRGATAGALTGFVGGFLADALGLGLLGVSSLTLTLAGYVAGAWGETIDVRAPVRPLLGVATTAVLAQLAALLVAILIGTGPAIGASAFTGVVPSAMLDLLLAVPLLPLVRGLLPRPTGGATASVGAIAV